MKGKIPEGHAIRHSCGNHLCVNPDHLFAKADIHPKVEVRDREGACIYALVDPLTQEVRYVGKTDRPQERLRKHLYEALVANSDTFRGVWIRHLNSLGLTPALVILEEVVDRAWEEAERYWITYYRKRGADLTNVADGGGDPSAAGLIAILEGKRAIRRIPFDEPRECVRTLSLTTSQPAFLPHALPPDFHNPDAQNFLSASASNAEIVELLARTYAQVFNRFAVGPVPEEEPGDEDAA